MGKLVNLGSLCIDHVYQVPNLSQAGETVASFDHTVFAGGKGLNQSLAAAGAGARVRHVGCIGNDGQFLLDTLTTAGVDATGVRQVDAGSGHAVIQVDPAGQNTIVIAGGANRCVAAVDIETALAPLESGDWLLLQNEINDLQAVLDAARGTPAKVAFNAAPADGRERDYDMSAVDLLIVNEIEAAALSGHAHPDAAFAGLRAALPSIEVVLTLGDQGLVYSEGSAMQRLPAFAVSVVDETAAGDAFIGFLMAGLLGGMTMQQALTQGSAAGAVAATRAGAASSIPQLADIQLLLTP